MNTIVQPTITIMLNATLDVLIYLQINKNACNRVLSRDLGYAQTSLLSTSVSVASYPLVSYMCLIYVHTMATTCTDYYHKSTLLYI